MNGKNALTPNSCAFRRTQSLRCPKGQANVLLRKGSRTARSKSSRSKTDSGSALSRLTFSQRLALNSSWKAMRGQTNMIMRKILNDLESASPKVKQIFYKAALVDCFQKEGSENRATLDEHIKLLTKFFDDLIANVENEAEVLAMIKKVGQDHAILNQTCGFHAEIWEQLGEIAMEKICSLDIVQKTREAGRAWRTVIACVTDEMRCGFDFEARVFSRKSSSAEQLAPSANEEEMLNRLHLLQNDDRSVKEAKSIGSGAPGGEVNTSTGEQVKTAPAAESTAAPAAQDGPSESGKAWNLTRKNSKMDFTGQNSTDSQPEAYSEHTLNAIGQILNRKTSVAHIMSKTAEGLNQSFDMRNPSCEELIYDLFKIHGKEEASIVKLVSVLRSFGLRDDDPRLRGMREKMMEFETVGDYDECESRHFRLSKAQFTECIRPSITLISDALRNQLIIPNFGEFKEKITEIFNECMNERTGTVASYIPQLARQDPNKWGMSICTIDGQRYSLGDAKIPFCVQSVSKAFNYAIVASDVGTDYVHSYVGHEPSGRLFNEICLDSTGKPHNPLVNAGAIIVTSLLKSKWTLADRYDFVLNQYRKLAGGGYVGFNNATFLSERETADRNYAISYYMKENGCFPPGTRTLREELDLYFQLCSIETTCESAAVMAATLANGGVCPLTDERCIDPRPCRDVLSLMYSCGMYDYSGQFAFKVGLPAKSGVSGAMIVVVPNLMGICLWSPPLDKMGNTTRGVKFCEKLIDTFNFHNYDSLLHTDSGKIDPRRHVGTKETDLIVGLLYAVKNGDLDMVRRLYLQGANMNMADYDGRTALHLAAAEGHPKLVRFLMQVCKADHSAQDRWNHTPLDDARHFNNHECVRILTKYIHRNSISANSAKSVTIASDTDNTKLVANDEVAAQANGSSEEEENCGVMMMTIAEDEEKEGSVKNIMGSLDRLSLCNGGPLEEVIIHEPDHDSHHY
ncbi:hypothetical protein QR680_000868 [Steinernema hermaphroditum]|uniref:glutaminase n=1 Tax=Steinernema hermaphroditum TaxID=289476 RepID=A0AA39GX01_9BILA|nr:hypothetical protein QR680_000868 [Steinernema hermaphroditum]